MALEGPQLRYVRAGDVEVENEVSRALRLAREVEELLEEPSSRDGRSGAHSTRMARAMAASLVDELEGLARGTTKSGVA